MTTLPLLSCGSGEWTGVASDGVTWSVTYFRTTGKPAITILPASQIRVCYEHWKCKANYTEFSFCSQELGSFLLVGFWLFKPSICSRFKFCRPPLGHIALEEMFSTGYILFCGCYFQLMSLPWLKKKKIASLAIRNCCAHLFSDEVPYRENCVLLGLSSILE